METHQQQMIDWQVALVAEPSRAPSPSAKRPAGSQVEIFRRQSFDQMGNIFLSKALNSDSVAELGARHTAWADGLVVSSRVSISFLIRCSFLMKIWLNCVQSRESLGVGWFRRCLIVVRVEQLAHNLPSCSLVTSTLCESLVIERPS